MEKFQSLADFLGVPDPQQPGRPAASAPSGKMTRKQFCKELLATKEYRESLLQRIVLGTLPPAVEVLLYHYADGKPVDKIEVKDTTEPLEEMTVEQLEERAMRLMHAARALRGDAAANEEDSQTPIH